MTVAEDQARAVVARYSMPSDVTAEQCAQECYFALRALLAERPPLPGDDGSIRVPITSGVVYPGGTQEFDEGGMPTGYAVWPAPQRPLDRVTDEIRDILGSYVDIDSDDPEDWECEPEDRWRMVCDLRALLHRPEGREAAEEWEPDPRTLRWAADRLSLLPIQHPTNTSPWLRVEADRIEAERG